MTDQSTSEPANSSQPRTCRPRRGGAFVIALIAVAVAAGLTGNLLSTAFGQGFGWRSWHHDGFMGAPFGPAQIDERIDRMTKHMAIELDATADQQAKIASIFKSAVADLSPLRDKAQAARAQAITLLTASTIDRAAIEKLRADQIGLAEAASKRIAQALTDAADVLTPEQRRKLADWTPPFGGPWARWHRG
jgi:periplasmic protein CpxP/Spy